MTLAGTLKQRYEEVQARVATAAARVGRRPDQVILVAVTKNAGAEAVRELYELGHRDFGESHVQQLVQRAAILEEYLNRLRVVPQIRRDPAAGDHVLFPVSTAAAPAASIREIRWHMIGHLQRNKAKKIVDLVRLIHSVDSLRLAEELQQVAIRKDQTIEVLVQVNCSGEESKFGCPMPAAMPLCEQIESMMNLRVRGLMTMAAPAENPEDARSAFRRCRELFEEVKKTGVGEGRFNLLSMGMSGDFEVAIAEGANIVRVGTAIFGEASRIEEFEEQPESEDAEDDNDDPTIRSED
jgi:pyridoxal phosphate enzyme (YggS family)